MAEEPVKDNLNTDENDDDYEADQNLLGFFRLLLEVDMRLNPQLYQSVDKKDLPPKEEIKK